MWLAVAFAFPLQVPETEDPAVWTDVATAAGMELEDVQGGAGARVVETDEGWVLLVRDVNGGEHTQAIQAPLDPATRADVVWLAVSLIEAPPPQPSAELPPEVAAADPVAPGPQPAPEPMVPPEPPAPPPPEPPDPELPARPDVAWTIAAGVTATGAPSLGVELRRGGWWGGVHLRGLARTASPSARATGLLAGYRLQPGPLAVDGLLGLDARRWSNDDQHDQAVIPWTGARVGMPLQAGLLVVEPRLAAGVDLRRTVVHLGAEQLAQPLVTLGCQIGVGW